MGNLIYDVKLTSNNYPLNSGYKVTYDGNTNLATEVATGLPAQNISYNKLIGNGLRVSIPDTASSIVLYNSDCGTNVTQIIDNPTTLLPPPTGFTTSQIESTSLSLLWDQVPDSNSYEVEMLQGQVTTQFYNLTSTSLNINSLSPGTQYSFRIRTRNSIGAGTWSNYINTNTLSSSQQTYQVIIEKYSNIPSSSPVILYVNGSSYDTINDKSTIKTYNLPTNSTIQVKVIVSGSHKASATRNLDISGSFIHQETGDYDITSPYISLLGNLYITAETYLNLN